MKLLLLVTIMVALLSAAAFSQKSFNFIVTDLEGLEQLQTNFGPFQQLLEEKTGFKLNFFPVTNRTAAVEAVKSKKADFVLTGPAEYIVMQNLTKCVPMIAFSRPDYFACIVVKAEGDISSVADLKGKKIAFSSIGSTSGHLAPAQVLADNGVPMSAIKAVHTSREIGWESLKKGDVAAWAYGNSSVISTRNKDNSINPGAFKIIARGPDLPNDVLVAGTHVAKADLDRIVTAIAANSAAFAEAILRGGDDNNKYRGMEFIVNVKDSDYNYVRSMYKTIGQPRFSEFLGE